MNAEDIRKLANIMASIENSLETERKIVPVLRACADVVEQAKTHDHLLGASHCRLCKSLAKLESIAP